VQLKKLLHFVKNLINHDLYESLVIWLHFWHFYHNHATKELLQGHKTSPEMLIYRFSARNHNL